MYTLEPYLLLEFKAAALSPPITRVDIDFIVYTLLRLNFKFILWIKSFVFAWKYKREKEK